MSSSSDKDEREIDEYHNKSNSSGSSNDSSSVRSSWGSSRGPLGGDEDEGYFWVVR